MMEDDHADVTRRRLFGLTVLIVIALIAGGIWFHNHEVNAIRTKKYNDLHAITALKVGQISAWRQERLADARVNTSEAIRDDIIAWLRAPSNTRRANLISHFGIIKEAYKYRDVILATPDGRILIHHSQGSPNIADELKPLISTVVATQRATMGDLHQSTNRNIALDVAAPVNDVNGRTVAVLVLRTDPETQLYPLIQSWPTPSETAETLLVRLDGDAVLFLNDLRHQTGAALTLRIPMFDTDVPAVQAALGHVGVFLGRDYRGIPVVSDMSPVPDSPWFMIGKIDSREILAEVHYRSGIILALIALSIGMMAALASYLNSQQRRRYYKDLYRAERVRRESQEEIRATLYGIGDGVIATDAVGNVRRMNPVAEALTGWSEAEAIGKPITSIFRIVNEETRATVDNPVERVLKEGRIVGLANHTVLISRDNREHPIADSGAPIRDEDHTVLGAVLVFRDQTEQHRNERRREMSLQVMSLLNRSHDSRRLIEDLLYIIKDLTGVAAIGIRLRDGIDFPYYHTSGLTDAFMKAECSLCARDSTGKPICDEAGNPVLECMCGKVLQGCTDPALPFFTPNGSFWTNNMTDPTAINPQEGYERLRLRCLTEGYASIALIPLRSADETIGLLQLSESRSDVFTLEMIQFLEGISTSIGIALARRQAAEELQQLLEEAQQSRQTLLSMMEEEKRMTAERDALEEQVRQQQRLETVGQLAAGIAHDFNNLLTGISGFTRFALDSLPENALARQDLHQTLELTTRAENLVRQLLAFSRRQTLQPVVLNINKLVENLSRLLDRLLGEQIKLVIHPTDGLGNIKADPGQIEQVMVNLVVNARDAMTAGGTLTIETANVELDECYAHTHAGTQPGRYVMLSVSDTGCGMESEVLERVFEPFYTTKGIGRGTGLGLPTVYGIVKQHDGNIWIYSELNKGTTVKVYLPRVDTNVSASTEERQDCVPRGAELVLIVEDENAVREIAKRILIRHGYQVLTAATPAQADAILTEHGNDIDLLLTDVILPERSGPQVYEAAHQRFPHLRVLYMSGYTDETIAHQGVLEPGTPFIQKPFTVDSLTRKISQVMDGTKDLEVTTEPAS